MFDTPEFCTRLGLTVEIVEIWVAEGWLLPEELSGDLRFSETDLARARLIADLHQMGINNEAMVVVLHLIDQVHGLRSSLQGLVAALHAQPDAIRRQVVDEAQRLARTREG